MGHCWVRGPVHEIAFFPLLHQFEGLSTTFNNSLSQAQIIEMVLKHQGSFNRGDLTLPGAVKWMTYFS